MHPRERAQNLLSYAHNRVRVVVVESTAAKLYMIEKKERWENIFLKQKKREDIGEREKIGVIQLLNIPKTMAGNISAPTFKMYKRNMTIRFPFFFLEMFDQKLLLFLFFFPFPLLFLCCQTVI